MMITMTKLMITMITMVIVNGKTKSDRERYVSGTCALDLVHEVPQETFVRVLRSLITMITILTMMMKKMMTTIEVLTTMTMTILRERLHFVYILTLIMLANLRFVIIISIINICNASNFGESSYLLELRLN